MPSAPAPEEVVVVPWSKTSQLPASSVRTTLISSSLRSLRAHGHFDRYARALPREHHEAVLRSLGPSWLPIEHAVAHYTACDALGLGQDELNAIGSEVGERIQGTFMGTLAKTMTTLGVTPWLPFGQFQRLWDRVFQGGGVAVYRLGPSAARVEIRSVCLARIEYFRRAFGGVIHGSTLLFCKKATVRVLPELCGPDRLGFSCTWV
jgi:hypothetical protein